MGHRRAARPRGADRAASSRIGNLSGGQRRLDVAIGIVGRPELLFLDEPTAGLDPAARRDFHDLVHRLTDREQATVLLTTHDLAEADRARWARDPADAYVLPDLVQALFFGGASIVVLFLMRGYHVPGTTFSLGSLTLPSVIGAA